MEIVFHPISGEKGYFCTVREKELFDALILDNRVCSDSFRSSLSGVNNG